MMQSYGISIVSGIIILNNTTTIIYNLAKDCAKTVHKLCKYCACACLTIVYIFHL